MTDKTESDHAEGTHAGRPYQRELAACGAALVLGVCVELLIAWFTHHKGVNLTGDEPAYIIQAQSYLHLKVTILTTIKADLTRHRLAAYPVGVTPGMVAQFLGPRGVISPFEPGLGILLIPFVATGHLFLGATTGMAAISVAGLVYLHRRTSRLMHLSRRGQLLLALALVAPAILVAVTQIYPDFLSGVFLACALVEVALLERTQHSSRFGSLVILVTLAWLPWLQIKNLVPAGITLAVIAIVRHRARASQWHTVALVGVVCVSWAVLLIYNARYFGHLGGLPEPSPNLGKDGIEYTLGLLIDRDQGLFIQVPVAILGLVGLWTARRRVPFSVVASVGSVLAILILNGTYSGNPYGGRSLAGRFMWSLIPIFAIWIGSCIERWQEAGRSLKIPAGVIAILWIVQAIPIVDGSHLYYNPFQTPPLPAAAWSGWWHGVDRFLPMFGLPGHYFGEPASAILVVLCAGALVIAAVGLYGSTKTLRFDRRKRPEKRAEQS